MTADAAAIPRLSGNLPVRIAKRVFLLVLVHGGRTRRRLQCLSHGARHSSPVTGVEHLWRRVVPATLRGPVPQGVFNVDLHPAVIDDVRLQVESRGIPLTSLGLDGRFWAPGSAGRAPVAIVNERTWQELGPRRVRAFRLLYGSYLRQYDGFVATYTPSLGLLYEGLGPTLVVCATRYEHPFTYDARRWHWLDQSFREGVAEGWLTVAANNRADADYLRAFTGLDPVLLPSSCGYAAPSWSGRRPEVLVAARPEQYALEVCDRLSAPAVGLRTALGPRYSRARLYEHRAVVAIPYNASQMALLEHYAAGMPLYVPTPEFVVRLHAEAPRAVLSELSFTDVLGRGPAARRCEPLDLNDTRDPAVVDWYVERADFYSPEWMPHVRQFESWAHLDHLLRHDDHDEISARMAADEPARRRRLAACWDAVPWVAQVEAARALRGRQPF